MFQSEVFFDTGQAQLLPEGRAELDKLASADRPRQADPERNRLGAAGRRPYRRAADQQSAVQVELGAVFDAISVVQYLISLRARVTVGRGWLRRIPAARCGVTEEAYKRNRRIELKLTERVVAFSAFNQQVVMPDTAVALRRLRKLSALPGIRLSLAQQNKSWMAGTSPAMTVGV